MSKLPSNCPTATNMPKNQRDRRRAKLTESDVISIFKAKAIRNIASKIGREYGVSEKTIRDIWSGRTWAKETWHLEPSRTLVLRQVGRPRGIKDSKPRQKRVLRQELAAICSGAFALSDLRSHVWNAPSDPNDDTIDEKGLKGCENKEPLLPNSGIQAQQGTVEPLMTIDEQLGEWDVRMQCVQGESNPFEHDWDPTPFSSDRTTSAAPRYK